jgi:hypothetical protein
MRVSPAGFVENAAGGTAQDAAGGTTTQQDMQARPFAFNTNRRATIKQAFEYVVNIWNEGAPQRELSQDLDEVNDEAQDAILQFEDLQEKLKTLDGSAFDAAVKEHRDAVIHAINLVSEDLHSALDGLSHDADFDTEDLNDDGTLPEGDDGVDSDEQDSSTEMIEINVNSNAESQIYYHSAADAATDALAVAKGHSHVQAID